MQDEENHIPHAATMTSHRSHIVAQRQIHVCRQICCIVTETSWFFIGKLNQPYQVKQIPTNPKHIQQRILGRNSRSTNVYSHRRNSTSEGSNANWALVGLRKKSRAFRSPSKGKCATKGCQKKKIASIPFVPMTVRLKDKGHTEPQPAGTAHKVQPPMQNTCSTTSQANESVQRVLPTAR